MEDDWLWRHILLGIVVVASIVWWFFYRKDEPDQRQKDIPEVGHSLSDYTTSLLQEYKRQKRQSPLEIEEEILLGVWQRLYFGYEDIANDACEQGGRMRRVDKEIAAHDRQFQNLINVFDAVLYVAKGISPRDGEIYIEALKNFIIRSKLEDLDYRQELENIVRPH
jgi:hypothetical protein